MGTKALGQSCVWRTGQKAGSSGHSQVYKVGSSRREVGETGDERQYGLSCHFKDSVIS